MRRPVLYSSLTAGFVLTAAMAMPTAEAATVRYASPTGSSSAACTQSDPCSLAQAAGDPNAEGEVIVTSGSYTLSSTLKISAGDLRVHGVLGQPRPIITTSADDGIYVQGGGVRISDLDIEHSGAGRALAFISGDTFVTRMRVHSTNGVACFFYGNGRINDTLCNSEAAGREAVRIAQPTVDGAFVRNLTAVADGAGAPGVLVSSNTSGLADLRNVIASGDTDLKTELTSSSGSTLTLRVSNTNYVSFDQRSGGTIERGSDNQAPLPVYEAGTYRPTASSPTVDAGATDEYVSDTDLDGSPRQQGSAVDIGAYEYQPRSPQPPATALAPNTYFTKVPRHKIPRRKPLFAFAADQSTTFFCQVDQRPAVPCASPFRARTKGKGKHTLTVTAVGLSGLPDPTPAFYQWKVKPKARG